jgi:hypothetical protein
MPSVRYTHGRDRGNKARRRKGRVRWNRNLFVNPYPWMSDIEARVHLYLEDKQVPFSWRYMNVPDSEIPHLRMLMPAYHAEFTLKDYKIAIVVMGNFYGTLPGVLDKHALAQVALEEDGWKCALLWEDELRIDIHSTMHRELPELQNPHIRGGPAENPWGLRPTYMDTRRGWLKAFNLRKKRFIKPTDNDPATENIPPAEKRNRALGTRHRPRAFDRRTRVDDPKRRKRRFGRYTEPWRGVGR